MDDDYNLYGASWINSDPADRRVSARYDFRPGVRDYGRGVGFRLVGPEDSSR